MAPTLQSTLLCAVVGTVIVSLARRRRVGVPPAEKGIHPSPHHKKGDQVWVGVTHEPLNLDEVVSYVSHPGAGAICTFSGTTRDNFEGKEVVRLEYECYTPMALKEMNAICEEVLSKYGAIKVALVHRLGAVGVREASVLIAVSTVHRQEGLDATKYVIDTLKSRVPIWKKELYGGPRGESAWKENKEFKK